MTKLDIIQDILEDLDTETNWFQFHEESNTPSFEWHHVNGDNRLVIVDMDHNTFSVVCQEN